MTRPVLFHTRDYRGATVEDLDIKPAISITPRTLVYEALEISFENEFTYLPVVHEQNKKLLGILNVGLLRTNQEQIQKSSVEPIAMNYMTWFHQGARQKYKEQRESTLELKSSRIFKPNGGKSYVVITPMTPLEDLASFFNSGQYFAIITNHDGIIVYGVATPEDLIKYENSRPKL